MIIVRIFSENLTEGPIALLQAERTIGMRGGELTEP